MSADTIKGGIPFSSFRLADGAGTTHIKTEEAHLPQTMLKTGDNLFTDLLGSLD